MTIPSGRLIAALLATGLIAASPDCHAQSTDPPSPAEGAGKFDSLLAQAKYDFVAVKDYARSADDFTRLLAGARTEDERTEIFGLANASLYALGRHVDAFEAICRENARGGSAPQRWMFDVHAHARKIALNEGYQRSVELMRSYRSKCRIDSFSPIWAAIPLAKMEYLKSGVSVLSEAYVLPEKDRVVLKQVLSRFPDDPNREYAEYFLHNFSAVTRPDLIALSRAKKNTGNMETDEGFVEATPKLARRDPNADPYVRTQLARAPEEERTKVLAALESSRCMDPRMCELLTRWVPKAAQVQGALVAALYPIESKWQADAIPEPAEIEDYARLFFAYSANTSDPTLRNVSSELQYFLQRFRDVDEAQKHVFLRIYINGTCSDSPDCLAFLRHFSKSTRARSVAADHVRALVYAGADLSVIATFVTGLPAEVLGLDQPDGEIVLTEFERHVLKAVQLWEASEFEALLEFAIQIRGRFYEDRDRPENNAAKFPYLAAAVFAKLMVSHAGKPLGERAHWLAQSIEQRVGDPTGIKRRERLEGFIASYPRSRLLDDAMAELGLLHLVQGEPEKGREFLVRVWKELPRTNAADNALYHLAQDALDNGKYLTAAGYFSNIVASLSRSRFYKEAREEAPLLRGASEALRQRKTLEGLAIDSDADVVLIDASKFEATEPILRMDKLVRIGGKEIASEHEFYSQLDSRRPGEWIDLTLERQVKSEQVGQWHRRTFKARGKVGLATVFDVRFVGYTDQLFVRERPHNESTEVGSLKSRETCIRFAGEESSAGKGSPLWLKITHTDPEGRMTAGWVNAAFLRRSTTCLE